MNSSLSKSLRVFSVFTASCLLVSGSAFAEKTGNGGTAWVCRETLGKKSGQSFEKIRWIELQDLFEAREEYGLSLAGFTGNVDEIVSEARGKLRQINGALEARLPPYFERLGNLSHQPPVVVHGEVSLLEKTEDVSYRTRPRPESCRGGVIDSDPAQVVNYRHDGTVMVRSDLIASMSTFQIAALVFHEAIYRYLRDLRDVEDSSDVRKVVAYVFSDLSAEEVRHQLFGLGLPAGTGASLPACTGVRPEKMDLGFRCESSAGGVFQRVWTLNLGKGWMDPDGFIWSAVPGKFNFLDAVRRCKSLDAALPRVSRLKSAYESGLGELFPRTRYWTSTYYNARYFGSSAGYSFSAGEVRTDYPFSDLDLLCIMK